MITGGNRLEEQFRQAHIVPSYRYRRSLGQLGLLPDATQEETKEAHTKRIFDTVKHAYVLSSIGYSVNQIAEMDFLRIKTNSAIRPEEIEGQPVLTEISKRCDEMSLWIKSLQEKIKPLIKTNPLTHGSKVEAAVRDFLKQNGFTVEMQGSPLRGKSSVFDLICTTKNGLTIFVEIRSKQSEQKKLVDAVLAHARFSNTRCFSIKKLREEKGYSLRGLSKRSGVAKTTLMGMEKGQYVPDKATWRKLASALNVPMMELVNFLVMTLRGDVLTRTGILSEAAERNIRG